MTENPFVNIQVDQTKLEERVLQKVEDKMSDIDNNKIYYSMDDLVEITSFSKGHIMNTFFEDPRFQQIRRKVGRKWVFPVDETNEFLREWILEQPNE